MADVTVAVVTKHTPANWLVPLSSLPGSTDDERLAAFMSWAGAQTYAGATCLLDEMRTYTFATSHPLYSGFAIQGAMRSQDQARSSKPIGQQVNMRMNGGMFTLAQPQTFGCHFQGLSLDGTASSRLVQGHASNVLWTSVFRDISCQNAAGVLGSSSQKLLNTACAIDGWWNVNNVRDRAFNLGGSDTMFKPTEMLLDSPPALMPDSGFLLSYNSQAKGSLSGLYLTADAHSGLLLSGGAGVMVHNNVIEGRNAGTPCKGALVRIQGGRWLLRDNVLNYAMTDPPATGRDDAGVIHVASGTVLVDGVDYSKATAATEQTPLVYAASGRVIVRNVLADFKPVVRQAVEGLVDADNSVTVVTG